MRPPAFVNRGAWQQQAMVVVVVTMMTTMTTMMIMKKEMMMMMMMMMMIKTKATGGDHTAAAAHAQRKSPGLMHSITPRRNVLSRRLLASFFLALTHTRPPPRRSHRGPQWARARRGSC